jgi:hypothetical protein
MGLDVLIWGFGIAVFGVAARRAFDMMGQRRWLAAWAWYFVSFIPLGVASQVWVVMNNPIPTTRWIILGVAGAAIGATAFVTIGEAIRPTKANGAGPIVPGASSTTRMEDSVAQTTNPSAGNQPVQAPPSATGSPTITIPGSGNILNFGSAGNITQNSEAKAREAIRDPDGIYQLDQKVGTVVAARSDLSHSSYTFEEIISPQDTLDINRDFQYREYVLRVATPPSSVGSNLGGLRSRKYVGVQCTIMGRISSTP